MLPSPDAGPEALYVRGVLLEELEEAVNELDGRSFTELSTESGTNVNTLLSRKRYAVLFLRQRLQTIYDELTRG